MKKQLAVIAVMMMLIAHNAAAELYVGVLAGKVFGEVDPPTTMVQPTIRTNADSDNLLSGVYAGHRSGAWSVTVTYGVINGDEASSAGKSGTTCGVVSITQRTIDNTLLAATVGHLFKLDEEFGVEINAGVVYWRQHTVDANTTSAYVINPDNSVTLSNTQRSTLESDTEGTSGTVGISLLAKAGPINARMSAQYYGGLQKSVVALGLEYPF